MSATSAITRIIQTIEKAYMGNRNAVEFAVCTFLSEGHLLIEDTPGVGKTTLAKAMAAAFGGSFSRIQFTSDLLPADILGISIWKGEKDTFEFQKGPVFANVVLADEINRASPKTQSALLEAMSERQVSQEGQAYQLPAPFMVIATQNASDSFGTYPLPESQLDRFTMRIHLGYAPPDVEKQLVRAGGNLHPESVTAAVSTSELNALKDEIEQTHMDDSVLEYLMTIVAKTRSMSSPNSGSSPRGSIALYKCAKAFARIQGRDYVLSDDIQKLTVPVLAHRLSGRSDGIYSGEQMQSAKGLLKQILQSSKAPI
ncbi:MAG: MoxR family ATPase [Deltaproteobacteria bacterium]|nr:MoxR family ATPase [Deltaproteobacteria bacterium]